MRPIVRLLTLAALSFAFLAPEVARAQDEEPTDETSAAPSEATEAEPVAETEDAFEVPDANRAQFGLGARVRYVFMPTAVLDLFLDHSTSMGHLGGVGAEIIRRKGNLDVVFGIEYDYISPEDGLYLEKGDQPTTDCYITGECPDLVEFDNFAILGADVSLIWHARLAERVSLRYGAGIGIAAVLGDLKRTPATACLPGTTVDDLDDPNACPVLIPGEVKEGSEAGVPPVVPIVNLLLGVRDKVNDQIAVNVETGFRDVFFAGIGAGYVF